MGGDFNLTIKVGETWGEGARQDPLTGYFVQLFEDAGLCDIEPNEMVPTWRNFRSGIDGVSEHLARFLVAERVLEESDRLK